MNNGFRGVRVWWCYRCNTLFAPPGNHNDGRGRACPECLQELAPSPWVIIAADPTADELAAEGDELAQEISDMLDRMERRRVGP